MAAQRPRQVRPCPSSPTTRPLRGSLLQPAHSLCIRRHGLGSPKGSTEAFLPGTRKHKGDEAPAARELGVPCVDPPSPLLSPQDAGSIASITIRGSGGRREEKNSGRETQQAGRGWPAPTRPECRRPPQGLVIVQAFIQQLLCSACCMPDTALGARRAECAARQELTASAQARLWPTGRVSPSGRTALVRRDSDIIHPFKVFSLAVFIIFTTISLQTFHCPQQIPGPP